MYCLPPPPSVQTSRGSDTLPMQGSVGVRPSGLVHTCVSAPRAVGAAQSLRGGGLFTVYPLPPQSRPAEGLTRCPTLHCRAASVYAPRGSYIPTSRPHVQWTPRIPCGYWVSVRPPLPLSPPAGGRTGSRGQPTGGIIFPIIIYTTISWFPLSHIPHSISYTAQSILDIPIIHILYCLSYGTYFDGNMA
jgi:hypothetical protein